MLVLLVQCDKEHIVIADDVAAPLLNRNVVVQPVTGTSVLIGGRTILIGIQNFLGSSV
jgi:hypothetical protein